MTQWGGSEQIEVLGEVVRFSGCEEVSRWNLLILVWDLLECDNIFELHLTTK